MEELSPQLFASQLRSATAGGLPAENAPLRSFSFRQAKTSTQRLLPSMISLHYFGHNRMAVIRARMFEMAL